MAGTGWQSSDLLTRFNEWAGRPTTGDSITDAQKYRRLSDGQDAVIAEMANVAGSKSGLFGTPTLMTSTDGGYTYTFGTDGNGYANYPLAGRIYPTLSAIPDYPWTPGRDYLDEGTQIRSLNNAPFPLAPYFYGITQPAQLSATTQSVIQPPQARLLIVIQAVRSFAEEQAKNPELVAAMNLKWQMEWGKWSVAIRKHLRGRGSLGPLTSNSPASPLGGGIAFGGLAG